MIIAHSYGAMVLVEAFEMCIELTPNHLPDVSMSPERLSAQQYPEEFYLERIGAYLHVLARV